MNADVRGLGTPDPLVHAPARLMILTILHHAERVDFLYLLRETGLTKGNLATHLSKLEASRYLEVEKTYRGKVPLTLYRMTEEGRAALRAYGKHLLSVVASIGLGAP